MCQRMPSGNGEWYRVQRYCVRTCMSRGRAGCVVNRRAGAFLKAALVSAQRWNSFVIFLRSRGPQPLHPNLASRTQDNAKVVFYCLFCRAAIIIFVNLVCGLPIAIIPSPSRTYTVPTTLDPRWFPGSRSTPWRPLQLVCASRTSNATSFDMSD